MNNLQKYALFFIILGIVLWMVNDYIKHENNWSLLGLTFGGMIVFIYGYFI